jgi:hypothetical protein
MVSLLSAGWKELVSGRRWQCPSGGVQSKTHVVLASLNKAENELSSANKKVFKIDDHMGIAISGVTGDGRKLCKIMRNECLSHKCAPRLNIAANASFDKGRGFDNTEDREVPSVLMMSLKQIFPNNFNCTFGRFC